MRRSRSSAGRKWPLCVVAGALASACGGTEAGAECGEGTYLVGGVCVPLSEVCGDGTSFDGEDCVAPETATCGAGTHLDAGVCVANEGIACGAGTRFDDGQCVPEQSADCGPGTELVAGECLPDGTGEALSCGDGTEQEGGVCIAAGGTSCGAGTKLSDGECIVMDDAITCGAGTALSNGECLPSDSLVCGAGTVRSGSECIPGIGVTCGEGTALDGNECVPEPSVECGPGTELVEDECLPDGTGETLSCGDGTEREGDVCVAVEGVSCGAGTKLSDGECIPIDATVTCGAGTELSNGECLPSDSLVCGAGTVRAGDECVPGMGITCGDGTELDGNECVASGAITCGDGTVLSGDECVPIEVTCGPGTHLEGALCVASVTPVPTSATFTFNIAERGGDVAYFLDANGTSVHRYDLDDAEFLTPYTMSGRTVNTMSVTPNGDTVYVGNIGGRIDAFATATGTSSFVAAAPSTLIWLTVAGDYLYTIDDSGAWESHATFDRATGERVFSDDWRNASYGAVYAPTTHKIFTFRDSTSPNDIYFEVLDTATGALGVDTESPYHGDYALGHPIRVSPDESTVFVSSGVAFNAVDLTYKNAIGLRYVDLAFHGDRLYLLRAQTEEDSELVVLDSSYVIVDSVIIPGDPLRVFIHENEVTVFTRQATISTWTDSL